MYSNIGVSFREKVPFKYFFQIQMATFQRNCPEADFFSVKRQVYLYEDAHLLYIFIHHHLHTYKHAVPITPKNPPQLRIGIERCIEQTGQKEGD